MAFAPFDSLAVANQLEAAGFTRAQAQVQAGILQKQIESLQRQIEQKYESISNAAKEHEAGLRAELATKADLRAEIQVAKYELLKWMVTGFIANAALIIGVLGFLRY